MSNRRVPSLKEAVQAAEQWYESDNFWSFGKHRRKEEHPEPPAALVDFFMDENDRRLEDFPPLLLKCNHDDGTFDLGEILGQLAPMLTTWKVACMQFNNPDIDDLDECDADHSSEYHTFADSLGWVLRYGGIHIFLCYQLRKELRKSVRDETEAEREREAALLVKLATPAQ